MLYCNQVLVPETQPFAPSLTQLIAFLILNCSRSVISHTYKHTHRFCYDSNYLVGVCLACICFLFLMFPGGQGWSTLHTWSLSQLISWSAKSGPFPHLMPDCWCSYCGNTCLCLNHLQLLACFVSWESWPWSPWPALHSCFLRFSYNVVYFCLPYLHPISLKPL